jgi:hypothetical protein
VTPRQFWILAALACLLFWAGATMVAIVLLTGHGGGPRACSRPPLPSGDQMLRHGQLFTCTDGTWHLR